MGRHNHFESVALLVTTPGVFSVIISLEPKVVVKIVFVRIAARDKIGKENLKLGQCSPKIVYTEP